MYITEMEVVMKNNISLIENKENEEGIKIRLLSYIIMVGSLQIPTLFLIVLGLVTGRTSEVPLTILPFIVATLGLVVFILIYFRKNFVGNK